MLAAIALGAVGASERLAALATLPAVLWLTTIALLLAPAAHVRRLAGGPMLGNDALHLFLAARGVQSLVGEILRVGPAVFWFTVVVVGLHGLVLFGGGRALRLDLPTLAVASQANAGGPASAMAIATARGYPDRLLPGWRQGCSDSRGELSGVCGGWGAAGVDWMKGVRHESMRLCSAGALP